MFKVQKTQTQPWAASSTLIFPLEVLQDTLGGAPLHVVEVIVKMRLAIDTVGGFAGLYMPTVLGTVVIEPNETCDSSRVDGLSMNHLDHMLTGRVAAYADAAPPNADIVVAARLPFHGCILGGKAGDFEDLVSPVRRWRNGNIRITTTPAVPYAGADCTIQSGTVEVLFVCEPLPDAYVVGPMPVYDMQERPAGPSFTWTSKGRLMALGLSMLPGKSSEDYPSIDIRDACWVSSLSGVELQLAWQAMQGYGTIGNEPIGGQDTSSMWIPLLFGRACQAKLWTSPRFERGLRTVDVPGYAGNEDHRVMTAQLISSDGAVTRMEREAGSRARVVATVKDYADRLKLAIIGKHMPKRIPIAGAENYARQLAAQVRRRMG